MRSDPTRACVTFVKAVCENGLKLVAELTITCTSCKTRCCEHTNKSHRPPVTPGLASGLPLNRGSLQRVEQVSQMTARCRLRQYVQERKRGLWVAYEQKEGMPVIRIMR
jgi:hypothetical protein